jgi:RNA polymerase sigma factor (sigma-70 family)
VVLNPIFLFSFVTFGKNRSNQYRNKNEKVKEISDEILMNEVKLGELTRMTELFNRYHIQLFNYFVRCTADRDLSNDLTQNVFLRIIRYRQSFNDSNKFRTWMYQIARNVLNDNLKQNKLKFDAFEKVDNDRLHPQAQPEILENNLFENLDLALGKLAPDQLELLVLSRYQGLKYEEIAQIKSCTVASVKVQVYRAMQKLREVYFKINADHEM